MTDDTLLPFSFPAIRSKKITAAFDGGLITSNGGVLLLAAAERRLQLADRLPESGWPIDYCDLVPYYDKACDALGILPL